MGLFGWRDYAEPPTNMSTLKSLLATFRLIVSRRAGTQRGNAGGGKRYQGKEADEIRGEGPGDWATYKLR